MAVMVFFGAPWLAEVTGLSLSLLMLAAGVSAAQFVINVRLTIWQNENQPIQYGVFQFLQTLLNAGTSLFLVLYLSWGAAGRIGGIAFSAFSCAVIGILTLQRATGDRALVSRTPRPRLSARSRSFPEIKGIMIRVRASSNTPFKGETRL